MKTIVYLILVICFLGSISSSAQCDRLEDQLTDTTKVLTAMKAPDTIKKLYKLPFEYDSLGTRIVDADNCWVLDIRGWGRIQNLVPTYEGAAEIQDTFGQYVCDLLNANYNADE